jgi:hypothetical protein
MPRQPNQSTKSLSLFSPQKALAVCQAGAFTSISQVIQLFVLLKKFTDRIADSIRGKTAII